MDFTQVLMFFIYGIVVLLAIGTILSGFYQMQDAVMIGHKAADLAS